MENFESLNAIVNEFKIKKTTLDIFSLAELVEEGTHFKIVTEVSPADYTHIPEIIFEDSLEVSFCSIFSDSYDTTQTSLVEDSNTNVKLKFDDGILSSEFDVDETPILLTSDGNVNCLGL